MIMKTNTIFESIEQGILLCDRNGRIVYFNNAYGRFIGKELASVKGTPIRNLRPHCRVPDVLHSALPLEGILRKEGTQEYYVNIYPLIEHGSINGTISIVTTLNLSLRQVQSNPVTLKERVAQFERQEMKKCWTLRTRSKRKKGSRKKTGHFSVWTLQQLKN